jgi:hypothetical protein
MKAIKRPVLPPTLPSAFPSPLAAPLIAGPAEDDTLERPSEAFDLYSAAVCEALEAVSFAASAPFDVVDSNRRAVRPGSLVDCRNTARETFNDIVEMVPSKLSNSRN